MSDFARRSAWGWILTLATALVAPCGCNSNGSPQSVSSSDEAASQPVSEVSPGAADVATPISNNSSPASGGEFPIDGAAARPAAPAVAAGGVATAGGISLKTVDADAYAQVIAQHQGKVVLVDFWATWCGPCTEQFPHTSALARKFQDKGLAVVSVSFDDPEKQQSVLDFLQQHGATFENLISQHGAGVESGVSFDIVGGALPFYKLYDRSGKLRYQFTGNIEGLQGVLKIEELDQRIEELLGSRG